MKYAVYVGRFQPFHNGHLKLIRYALARFDRVIVFIGSSQESRTERNPYTFSERAAMIGGSLTMEELERVWVYALPDRPDNTDAWAEMLSDGTVNIAEFEGAGISSVTFVGTEKDANSSIRLSTHRGFYRKYFPLWGYMPVEPFDDLSASDIRDTFFNKGTIDADSVPWGTKCIMRMVGASIVPLKESAC